MDNNFNMPQGDYIMAQAPVKPKKKTGLIVGISVAVAALIAVIVAVVLIFVVGGKSDIVGTWEYSVDGGSVEMVFEEDGSGLMRMIVSGATFMEVEFTYEYDEDSMILKVTSDLGYDEPQTTATQIKELTSDTMSWEDNGETVVLKKVD